MKRILIVTYLFPPINTARSIRVAYIARYLIKQGWKVDVLAAYHSYEHDYDGSLLKLLPSEVTVYRTYSGPLNMLKHTLRLDNQQYSMYGLFKEISHYIRALKRRFPVPDEMNWVPFAVNKGMRLTKENRYDAIFSVAFPISSHVIGYILKRRFNIPWIVENGDPLSYVPQARNSGLKFVLTKKLEEAILKASDGIVLMTNETKRLYLEKFNFLSDSKIRVIGSGYEPESYSESIYMDTNRKFTIVYTGVTQARNKSLVSFYEAIKQLSLIISDFHENHEILMIGKIKRSEILEYSTEETRILGSVNFMEALSYMKGASILLLLGNEGGVQIPSKTYQYLGAKRPILAILGDEKDPLKDCLSGINRVTIVRNNKDEILNKLTSLYTLFKSGRLDTSYDLSSDISEYTWETSLKSLNDFIEDCI